MKTLKNVGVIIALVMSALSLSAFASGSTIANKAKVKAKTKHAKKHVAAKKGKKIVKKSAGSESAKLQTDINFNDSVLHGRYQTPDEATAKVENEKSLSDLLAVRTQFKDRLKKSSEQN